MEIRLIPALTDNYAYLLHDPQSGEVAVVDPSEAAPVVAAWQSSGWPKPTWILNTHHHWDHVGGNEALQQQFGAQIACSVTDAGRVPGEVSRRLAEGDRFSLGAAEAEILGIPGHTLGHIAFYFAGAGAVFVGDTLFGMGCGRLFEGDPPMMWRSLARLRGLPAETRVYCGHEYTEANAAFAVTIEPENPELRARRDRVHSDRRAGRPTIPFTIAEERATNPFLRSDLPAIGQRLSTGNDPVATFAELRRQKDGFAR